MLSHCDNKVKLYYQMYQGVNLIWFEPVCADI